jgi:phosphonate transport system substrate-binding protein
MLKNTTFSLALCALATASAFLIGSSSSTTRAGSTFRITEPKVLRFTAIPDNDETMLRERFKPLAEHLTNKMGVKFEYFHAPDYAASVKAFEKEDVFMSWFGGVTGLQARKRVPGSRAIAQGLEDKNFWSYIIANKKTRLTEGKTFPMGIQGKSFTFGSETSTSGRCMPEYFIREAFPGKKLDEIFSKHGFSGSHSKTIAFVGSGAWECGAVNGTDWDGAVRDGKQGDAIALWKTPTYQDYQWTVRGNMDDVYGAGFTEKLKKTLLEIDPAKSELEAAVMKAFTRTKFIEAKNEDYKALEDVAMQIGLLR